MLEPSNYEQILIEKRDNGVVLPHSQLIVACVV